MGGGNCNDGDVGIGGKGEGGTCGREATRGNANPIYQSATLIDERIWRIFNFGGSGHSQDESEHNLDPDGYRGKHRFVNVIIDNEEIVLQPGMCMSGEDGYRNI